MTKKKLLKPAQPELDRQLREFEAALYWMTGRHFDNFGEFEPAMTSGLLSTTPYRVNIMSKILDKTS
jgi:hypothetical protein